MTKRKRQIINNRIGCILLCDISGKVEKKIYDSLGLMENIQKGDCFSSLFSCGNREKSMRFLDNIVLEGIVIDCELNIDKADLIENHYFSGFLIDDLLFIFVLNQLCLDLSICKNILEINREAISLLNFKGMIGNTKKDLGRVSPESDDIYDSLSRLNNELINTQRELRKKQKELHTVNEKLAVLTITDELTGLYNRRFFWSKIEEEIERARRLEYSIAVVSIDINDFKLINDTQGHQAGDRMLKTFSEITAKVLRKSFDYAFRWGGDEFVLILNNCSKIQAQKIMERLDTEFRRCSNLSSLAYGIVILGPGNDSDIETALKDADREMYKKKASLKRK